jgi:hypothetical protein
LLLLLDDWPFSPLLPSLLRVPFALVSISLMACDDDDEEEDDEDEGEASLRHRFFSMHARSADVHSFKSSGPLACKNKEVRFALNTSKE